MKAKQTFDKTFEWHNFNKTEAESNKYLLPEQLEKDIDTRALPELSVFFPDHPIKAAMESYLTRGQGLEPAGKSFLNSTLMSNFICKEFNGFVVLFLT